MGQHEDVTIMENVRGLKDEVVGVVFSDDDDAHPTSEFASIAGWQK